MDYCRSPETMTDCACLDTGLALGLSLGVSTAAAGRSSSASTNPRRWMQKLQPSLNLSLSDDDIDVQGGGGWTMTREEGRHGGHQGVEPRPSSPTHSTVSSFSAVKKEEAEVERAGSRRGSDDDADADGGARKKLRLTKDQSAMLEERFKEHRSLNPKQKIAMAKQLNLRPRQVEVWFQNRRARTKLKQTEVDCEFLKRCCESLTDENRRLQKELQDLKSLKFAPPPAAVYMQFPAATLTMCPSCKTVGGAGLVGSSSGGGSTESFVQSATTC